jgi:hypothetical protein
MDPQAIVLDKLQDDINYYGDYGKQFLSYSDIRVLFTTPNLFKQDTLKSKALIEGSYFHTAMLEPDRIKEYEIVDVASRSTKAYKEVCPPGEILLLRKEQEHLDTLVSIMKDSLEMSSIIYSKDNKFEVPGTESIMNNMWKGKADIVTDSAFQVIAEDKDGNEQVIDYSDGAVIDLKTTSDMTKPMLFLVIDKQTMRLSMRPVSADTIERGKLKVEQATRIYEKFFGDKATHDVNTFIDKQII